MRSGLTPEGYVREWVRNGSKSPSRLPAWEVPYQESGMIDEAEARGYIRIGRDVACTITLTEKGRALAGAEVQSKERITPAERTRRWRDANREKYNDYMRKRNQAKRAVSAEDRRRALYEELRGEFEGGKE